MELNKPHDLFLLYRSEKVSKRNLYDLIQYSKVENSPYWAGEDFAIGNTPQQGINWVGLLPTVKAVIIKTRTGAYDEDGWADEANTTYHYSFKARKSIVSYVEKANAVLINQPQHLYPIFLFTECDEGWNFEGSFSVSEIQLTYVILTRGETTSLHTVSEQAEEYYQEGSRRYVTHLMAERNRDVVKLLKNTNSWICEICNSDFRDRYGVEYIEAHHKTPISTCSSSHSIKFDDLALLCPSCHKAVHIYMKNSDLEYEEIKTMLS